MKKLMAIILSMAMVVSITACNSDNGNDNVTDRPSNNEGNNGNEDVTDRPSENQDNYNNEDITDIPSNNQDDYYDNQDNNTENSNISFESATVGGIVQFGNYNWLVLDIQDGKMLVLSDEVLAARAYNPLHSAIPGSEWENSDMRKYLNNSFYNGNFTEIEKKYIIEEKIENKNNQWHGTESGNDTFDKLFLLSLEEVVKYFGDSGQLERKPQYTVPITDEFDSLRIPNLDNGGSAPWLTRSPGAHSSTVADIHSSGKINVNGIATTSGGGVRPAMWLKIS